MDTQHPAEHGKSALDGLKAIYTRNFILVTTMTFIMNIIFYQMFVTSTPFAQKYFGVSLDKAAFCAGIIIVGAMIGRFFTGNLLSRFGVRPTLTMSLVVYLISVMCMSLSLDFTMMLGQRCLFGIGVGTLLTVLSTLIAYIIPAEHRGLGISTFSVSAGVALAVGPYIGITVADTYGYDAMNTLCMGFAAVILLLAFCLRDLPVIKTVRLPFFKLSSYLDWRVAKFGIFVLFVCMGYGCLQIFIVPYTAERGLSDSAGLVFLCYAVAMLVTRPVIGHMYDVRGEKVLLYPIFLITALANLLLALADTRLALLMAGLLLGIGYGNFQSIGQSIALGLVPRERFAQATTTFFFFFEIGNGFGPYLMGYIIPHIGFTGMYSGLAVMACFAAVMYWLTRGRHLVM